MVGPMTTALTVMLLVFVAEMTVIGTVTHARSQNSLYADFRSQLAEGVAPTGQVDADGKLLALGVPVAVMAIPSIGVKEVVAEGTTAHVLKSGPGHRRDTALPGQAGTTLIFGRQAAYGGPFRKVASLKAGAEIAFATGQGKALYRVTGIRRAGDPAPAADPTASRLTLQTGAGSAYLPSEVIRVDAELTSETFPSPARPVGAAFLGDNEGAMAGDQSGLLDLLLWSQLLLVLAVLLAWMSSVWGRWQSWIVCVPVFGIVGFQVAGQVAQLLPNML